MLESIHHELSNTLTSGRAEVELHTEDKNPRYQTGLTPSLTERAKRPIETTRSSKAVHDECDQLLAKLKQQLSNQLKQ